MTDQQKEILIAKMLDNPAALTEGELEAILHDPELSDIYNVSSAVSSAYTPVPEIDVKQEWEWFRPRIRRKPSLTRRMMRVAAIFLGVIVAGNIVGRLIDSAFTTEDIPAVTAQAPVHQEPVVELRAEEVAAVTEQPAIPGQKETLLADTHTGRKAVADAPAEIDIDEYLRIQQARIDNELAMQVAQTYTEEFNEIRPLLDDGTVDEKELERVLRQITMQ